MKAQVLPQNFLKLRNKQHDFCSEAPKLPQKVRSHLKAVHRPIYRTPTEVISFGRSGLFSDLLEVHKLFY